MKISMIFIFIFFVLVAGTAFTDENVTNFETRIVDDFDSATTLSGKPREWFWHVRGSKFIDTKVLEWKLVKGYPVTLFSKKQAAELDLHILGVKGGFERKGYNYYEIIPVTKDNNGRIISRPIELPGMVKTFEIWVWGSNFNYYVEAILLDSRGINHRLNLGSLLFEGWKNLSAEIPPSIPQSRRYIPKHEALYLTKLVIWTRPEERATDFYIYFDQMKVNTDTFISKFDGDELADLVEINKLWTEGAKIEP